MFNIEVFDALHTLFGLSKRNPKLKMKASFEDLNIKLPASRTNKHKALWLQQVELDGSFFILHIVLETYTI